MLPSVFCFDSFVVLAGPTFYIILATGCQIKADKVGKWPGAAPVWINPPWIKCV